MLKSNSQASQDLFAYYVCNTNNGYFLDFGSSDPIDRNNTYILEKNGWNGICFDIGDYTESYKNNRTSKFIRSDVNQLNLKNILIENNAPKIIDYISIDVDASTEELLNNFPFKDYEFKTITFEHDSYSNGNHLKEKSRKFFTDLGYKLLCADVGVTRRTDNDYFEDWYINEKYINYENVKYLSSDKYHHSKISNMIYNKIHGAKKECILLVYYVSDYIDEYILNKCIDSISKAGLDIILISHSLVSEKIYKKVKYFIYSHEKEEDLINFEDVYYDKGHLVTYKHFKTENFEVGPFLYTVDDLTYTYFKNVTNLYEIALALGYDYSYFFTADFEILEEEIEEMKKVSKMVSEQNKKGYFENYSTGTNAFFWYVDNKWILDNFLLNMDNKSEWLKYISYIKIDISVESFVDYHVKKYNKDLIIKDVNYWGHPFVDDNRSDLSKKKINPYSFDTGIFYLNEQPYIFTFDSQKEKKHWCFYIEYYDGQASKYDVEVGSNYVYNMYPIVIKNQPFTIRCIDSKTNKTRFHLNINDLNEFKNTFKITQINQ